MQIELLTNAEQIVERSLKNLHKQTGYALMQAINDTAFDVRKAEQREMDDSFEPLRPYVRRGVKVEKATRETLAARVYLETSPNKGNAVNSILRAQVFGGTRKLKKFERALIAKKVMPDDHYAVPGAAAQLDKYGDMKASQIQQILSWFSTYGEVGHTANMTDKKRARLKKVTRRSAGVEYFSGQPRGTNLPNGVWMRETLFGQRSRIRPVLIFIKWARYEKRYDFYFAAELEAKKVFGKHFKARFTRAMQNSKGFANTSTNVPNIRPRRIA